LCLLFSLVLPGRGYGVTLSESRVQTAFLSSACCHDQIKHEICDEANSPFVFLGSFSPKLAQNYVLCSATDSNRAKTVGAAQQSRAALPLRASQHLLGCPLPDTVHHGTMFPTFEWAVFSLSGKK
jgi:hypothetical protein